MFVYSDCPSIVTHSALCSTFQLKLVFSHLKVFLVGSETPKQRKKSRYMKRNEQLSSAQCFLNRAVGGCLLFQVMSSQRADKEEYVQLKKL